MYLDRTAADRVARMRERRKAAGLVEIRAWATPQQAATIRAYLDGQPSALTPAPAPDAVLPPTPPSPRPAPVRPTQQPEPKANGFQIAFSEKPKFELRERLKKAGWTFDPQRATWIIKGNHTALPDEKLSAAIRAAGGQVLTARI